MDMLWLLLLLAGVMGDNLLWDIVQVNNLTNIILISDQAYGPEGFRFELWRCNYTEGDIDIVQPLPPLVTVIIDCPHVHAAIAMQLALYTLSLGRRGILTRPVINWILTSPPDDLELVTDLMSKADIALVWNNKITPGQKVNFLKLSRSPDGSVIHQHVTGRPADVLELTHGILPAEFNGFNSEHLTIGTLESQPFAYEVGLHDGNSSWEGIALDLIRIMADKFNFKYSLVRSRDGGFGNKRSDGIWEGLIGMLVDEEVDLVATGLTAAPTRWEVVDFTYPFYITNYGVILRVFNDEQFSFLRPLKNQVWLVYILSALLVSQVVYSFSHWSTDDNSGMNCWIINSKITEFFIGALFQQGGIYCPTPGRIRFIMGSFWVLVLVICATYSGNLIATLSTHRVKLPFTTLEEFADQDVYLPTVVKSTNSLAVLMNTEGEAFRKIVGKFDRHPELLLEPGTDVLSKVESGPFVYISNSVLLQYHTALRKDCSLFTLPKGFGSSPKALALPQHSPFLHHFSKVVTQLLEGGIDRLWWDKHFPKDKCAESLKVSAEAKPVTVNTLAGLFLILISGVLFAFIMLLIEKCIYMHRMVKEGVTCNLSSL